MQNQLISVQFYEDTVVLVDKDNEALIAMKPIVTNMGLDWKSQHTKLTEKLGAVMVELTTTGGNGKQYKMSCLPLRKLPAWLYSISPNKVKPELRDKIIRYQEQCDDALCDYRNKGSAIRPVRRTFPRKSLFIGTVSRCEKNDTEPATMACGLRFTSSLP